MIFFCCIIFVKIECVSLYIIIQKKTNSGICGMYESTVNELERKRSAIMSSMNEL